MGNNFCYTLFSRLGQIIRTATNPQRLESSLVGNFEVGQMKELSKLTATQTMSSLEIAKLTEKKHSNVLLDIRRILA
jgi:hypothetical protein